MDRELNQKKIDTLLEKIETELRNTIEIKDELLSKVPQIIQDIVENLLANNSYNSESIEFQFLEDIKNLELNSMEKIYNHIDKFHFIFQEELELSEVG